MDGHLSVKYALAIQNYRTKNEKRSLIEKRRLKLN